MKRLLLLLCSALLLVSLTACKGEEETEEKDIELHISAASSLREALPEIISAYNKENKNIIFVDSYDSSGTLQTQIEAGAPCDLFLSAATKQMTYLEDNGYIDKTSTKNLLKGKLVLITHVNSQLTLDSFEDLTDSSVGVIAMGDVSSVPVGQYTQEVLQNMNLWEDIKEKINYATNVAAVLAWVESEDVDCGFVYATDAATTDKVRVIAEAPKESSREILYPAGITTNSNHKAEAEKFLEFLAGDEAQEIFIKYGFEIYEE